MNKSDTQTIAFPAEAIALPADLIEELSEGLHLQYACVVYGPAGKTRLIERVCPGITICDAREISDPRIINGCHAIIDGSIAFIYGTLIEAMRAGTAICFRRIDSNTRLLQHLLPVVHNRRITAANGTVISAHPKFRLVFTSECLFELRGTVFVGPVQFRYRDVLSIFGESGEYLQEVLSTVMEGPHAPCPLEKGQECHGTCLRDMPGCTCQAVPFTDPEAFLCARHFHALCQLQQLLGTQGCASNAARADLYQSVVNVLLRHDSRDLREERMTVALPPVILTNTGFAKTAAVESALRGILANIRAGRPTLLVGETGAGKTALVQYLCDNYEHFLHGAGVLPTRPTLRVINMSSDTDVSELLGGYRSIDLDFEIRRLYAAHGLKMPASADRRRLLEDFLSMRPDEDRARFYLRVLAGKTPFYFREGVLTEAMRNGAWILLDEINLASREVLEMLEAVLSRSELVLPESGSSAAIPVHRHFRIFACMNPAGDFGKKAYDTRAFSTVFFRDFSSQLSCIRAVVQTLSRGRLNMTDQIAAFYYEFKQALARREYSNVVEPLVSGRTLCRAISLMLQLRHEGSEAAAYRTFNLLFFTQLDIASRGQALALFRQHFPGAPDSSEAHKRVGDGIPAHFIITPRVELQLADVELAIESALPLLLQGDTSTGKTSMMLALAEKHGRRVIRINNHEQTDTADYLGHYVTDQGRIVFSKGPLVYAMENGCWLLLDELNLAPSEVIEVLNRLLDDNRELYIPELDETVRPHPHFRLFATQNINYAGRRGLAKSLRNRFVEIFFGEKCDEDLRLILTGRCCLPDSFVSLMLEAYAALRAERSINNLMTLRDLFRWAGRGPTGYQHLYQIGVDLLVSRQRTAEDRQCILGVLGRVFSRKLRVQCGGADGADGPLPGGSLVLTRSYRRLIRLIQEAWRAKEPVLLVGATGLGKTRIVEEAARMLGQPLATVNMHCGTENADFVGQLVIERGDVRWRDGPLIESMERGGIFLIDEINLAEDAVLERLNSLLEDKRTLFVTEVSRDVRAHEDFRIAATMNPGGDFGKRELSPALRNRFTEIFFDLEESEYAEVFRGLLGPVPGTDFYVQNLPAPLSIRRTELAAEFIRKASEEQVLERDAVWTEALDLIGLHQPPAGPSAPLVVESDRIGIGPYFVSRAAHSPSFDFTVSTRAVSCNMRRVLRALCLSRPVLLRGAPGLGKTSMVAALGTATGRQVVRINLSEQTELSDLLGTHVPAGPSVSFVESGMVTALRTGGWIILDEINLCTQSVIEGLNSLLDHRRSILANELSLVMHPESRIFGTMNPSDGRNGRKRLPKSFIDRFIAIDMEEYREEDVRAILSERFGPSHRYSPSESLRGNIKLNMLDGCFSSQYFADDTVFRTCGAEVAYASLGDGSYVPVHSQLPHLSRLMRCMERRLPVILVGGPGRGAMLRFVQGLLGLGLVSVDCSQETDTCDLLGQYCRAEHGSALFEWRDSVLVAGLRCPSLVLIHRPELVDKAVFDRLSGLFELDRHLSVFERGTDPHVAIHPACRIILCAEEPALLSPALQDRCVSIALPSVYSYLDVYRIFNQRSEAPFQMDLPDRALSLVGTDRPVDVAQSLDRAYRRFTLCGTSPPFLDLRLPIRNALKEEEIDALFPLPQGRYSPVDEELLRVYAHFRSFESPLPLTHQDRIAALQGRACPLIKLLDMPGSHGPLHSCRDVPRSLQDFKVHFMRGMRHKTLRDMKVLHEFSRALLGASPEGWHPPSAPTCSSAQLDVLVGDSDPLHAYLRAIDNERIRAEQLALEEIRTAAKEFFKYGTGSLEEPLARHAAVKEEYRLRLEAVRTRAERDFPLFKRTFRTVTLCDYYHDPALREFLQCFSDIFDAVLLDLWRTPSPCARCRSAAAPIVADYAALLHRDVRTMHLEQEYSRLIYSRAMHLPHATGPFVLEALLLDGPTEAPAAVTDTFTEDEINAALASLFPKRATASVVETRQNRVLLSPLTPVPPAHAGRPIFSSPEELLSLADPETDAEFYAALSALYKHESVLKVERNYRFFRYLMEHELTDAVLERFFMDANVHEYLDRLAFAEEFLSIQPSPLLYNSILRFKAFEIEDLHSRHLQAARIKLLKEPSLFETTLRAYAERFLLIPVTTVMDLRFARPVCQGVHPWGGPSGLIHQDDRDECAAWTALAESFSRPAVAAVLPPPSRSRAECITQFYQREPSEQFTYSEICLAKVFNFLTDNLNKNMYDADEQGAVLSLLNCALRYPFPPFLYFVFRFADPPASLSSGTGLGAGTGEQLLEESVSPEDVPDEYGKEGELNSEGDFLSNDGKLHSVSDKEGVEGVDDQNNGGSMEDAGDKGSGHNEGDNSIQEGNSLEEHNINDGTVTNSININTSITDDNNSVTGDNNSITGDNSSVTGDNNSITGDNNSITGDNNSITGDNNSTVNDIDNNAMEYKWEESKLNNKQTCDSAIGYNHKVEQNEKTDGVPDVLKEGDGSETVEGNGEKGEGMPHTPQVAFTAHEHDTARLVELLRTVLASNRNSKYKGGFKTGKKLNMRQIVPYIASDFRKDRIWMRRHKDDKSDYTIRIFIDNSRSMYDQRLIDILGGVYYKLSHAFAVLGVPVELYRFGRTVAACRVEDLTFTDDTTSIDWIDGFRDGINIVLTDGIFQNNAYRQDNFIVLMIDKGHLRQMARVSMVESKVFVEKYLDTFVLRYCIVKDVTELEHIFVTALSELIKSQ